MSKIKYQRAQKLDDLIQILDLQKQNTPESLTDEDKRDEGFITVRHSLELLTAMNNKCPHIIAKHDNRVVGYALCMHKSFRKDIEVLKSMFKQIEIVLNPIIDFIIMGQICIDKNYRKKGIFKGLYNFMEDELQNAYDAIITEVDSINQRSLNAHLASNFSVLKEYRADGRQWILLIRKFTFHQN